MILAALGAVLGNRPALDAVLAEIDGEGIQTIVHTGDLLNGAGHPGDVLDRIAERRIPGVQGDRDRRVAQFTRKQRRIAQQLSPAEYEALECTFRQCDPHHIEYLAALPRQLALSLDGVDVLVCHGAVDNPSESVSPDDQNKLERQREATTARIILCGKPFEPFAHSAHGTMFVNPGAVGKTPSAARYAVVSTEEEPWRADLRTVAY